MKPLGRVLAGVRTRQPIPAQLGEAPIAGLEYDSRRVGPGFLFFAFPGARADGREFARQAVAPLRHGARSLKQCAKVLDRRQRLHLAPPDERGQVVFRRRPVSGSVSHRSASVWVCIRSEQRNSSRDATCSRSARERLRGSVPRQAK